MFTDEFATPDVYTEIPCPDPSAGLYIRNRSGSLVRVLIPRDALAFQTGEALQRATNGQLAATPHCVRGISKGGKGVARNTFAVFMQPPLTENVGGGMTFAEFSRGKLMFAQMIGIGIEELTYYYNILGCRNHQ